MAKHNVYFDIPQAELGKIDANFHIHQDNEKLGRITISKGGIEYYPKHRKKNPIKINWSQFDAIMKQQEK